MEAGLAPRLKIDFRGIPQLLPLDFTLPNEYEFRHRLGLVLRGMYDQLAEEGIPVAPDNKVALYRECMAHRRRVKGED